MKDEITAWNDFLKTGSVKSYLAYRKAVTGGAEEKSGQAFGFGTCDKGRSYGGKRPDSDRAD